MNDLRYAARMLAKSPGFTRVAVALLGVRIGANVVIFSALDAVLLRPLPVKHPEDLVRMVQKAEFFDVLGVPALVGRTLNARDAAENPGMIPAVLSYGFWRRRFDGDPGVIGRTIIGAA